MQPFTYVRVETAAAAVGALQATPQAKLIAGGTNLIDLMKEGVERPAHLIDVSRLPLAAVEELPQGGLRLGAMARNTDVAQHSLVRRRYPVLAEALLAGASAQLRNMATVGGNLLQRTRCPYFTDTAFRECNKRVPGSGCGAQAGFQRYHAILGASEACIATHPSDMAVALAALDATVRVQGTGGERVIPIGDFHRLPGDTPQVDTTLGREEIILSVDLPDAAFARRSHYLKVRDRASYAFALVSAAVALDLDGGGTVRTARIALGGVAHKPWRATETERLLVGRPLLDATSRAAAQAAVTGARPYPQNRFKLELVPRTILRALATVAEARA